MQDMMKLSAGIRSVVLALVFTGFIVGCGGGQHAPITTTSSVTPPVAPPVAPPAVKAGTILGTFTTHAQPLQQSIDADGNVWIASQADNTVIQMSPKGDVLQTFTMDLQPDCTVIDSSGNVWICNQSSNSVTKMSPTGVIAGTYPTGRSPDSIAFDKRGYAWVTNSGENSLTVLNSSGTLVGTYSTGSGTPWNVVIDGNGNAWTDNFNTATVSEISASGTLIGVFSVGSQPQVMGIDQAGYIWVPNGGGISKLDPKTGATVCNVSLTGYIAGVGIGGLAVDGIGNVWAYGANGDLTVNGLFEVNSQCGVLGEWPVGNHAAYASVDQQGNVWLTNYGDGTILKIATADKSPMTPLVDAIP